MVIKTKSKVRHACRHAYPSGVEKWQASCVNVNQQFAIVAIIADGVIVSDKMQYKVMCRLQVNGEEMKSHWGSIDRCVTM